MKVCTVLATLAILGVAGVAEADYLIILRSGKEITVRRYEEQGDQIVYKRYGGKISIPKAHIASIKDLDTGQERVFGGSHTVQEPKATPRVTRPPAPAPSTPLVPEPPESPRHRSREQQTASQETPWERYMNAGWEAVRHKRWAEGERMFQAALTEAEHFGPSDTRLANTLSNLAFVAHSQGKYDQAAPFLRRALEIRERVLGPEHPDVGLALASLAETYLLQRKYAQAEPLYQRAVAIREKTPGNYRGLATSLENYARLLDETNRTAEAVRMRARAKEAWGVHAAALNQQYVILSRQGRTNEALEMLRRAMQIAPEFPDSHLNYGSLLFAEGNLVYERGNRKAGKTIFRQAEAELLLAIQLAEAKKVNQYWDIDEKKMTIAQSYFLLGDIYYYVYRDKAKAKILYQNAVKHKPDHPFALRALKTRFK